MNKTCKLCGYSGENMWRDNKYYCRSCGAEIDVTQPDPAGPSSIEPTDVPMSDSASGVIANVTCPICKNESNNTVQNGMARCSLCGTTFDPKAPPRQTDPSFQNAYQNASYNNPYSPAGLKLSRRQQLEKEKNNRIIWGCLFLCLFWPVGIYHFYKYYTVSQELSKLDD